MLSASVKKLIKYLALIMAASVFIGCAYQQRHYSSSVVQYLYPDKQVVEKPQIAALALPLKVGIAFVPDGSAHYRHSLLTEKNKMDLLTEIAANFKQYDFVHSIEIIPSAYLQPEGGFTNLDQIRTMYGVDVIALVSYDQHQFTDQDIRSFSYWTLIGMYVVPGELNDTHTMVDAAVYDIKSRKLLFRAPGVSHIEGTATPVNLSEQLRKDRLEGFEMASKDLVVNLDAQLQLFKEKVKEMPEEVKVTYREGYSGGGSIDFWFLIGLMLLGGYGLWQRKKQVA